MRRAWLTRNLVILTLVSLTQDAASELLYPLLPLFVTGVLAAPPVVLGLVEGSAEAAAGISKYVAGRWSDRRARRPFVTAGYGIVVTATAGLPPGLEFLASLPVPDIAGSVDELAFAMDEVGALGGASDHGVSKSLYGADPDGNEFEIMWRVPRDAWGDYEQHGVVQPLDLDAEVARWGGDGTPT